MLPVGSQYSSFRFETEFAKPRESLSRRGPQSWRLASSNEQTKAANTPVYIGDLVRNKHALVEQQRQHMEGFYDLLKIAKTVRMQIGKVFASFDADKNGSIDLHEFRTHLNEPLERMPFLARIFLSMDDDQLDGAP